MTTYCVNKNAQPTGEHEVHETTCEKPNMPEPKNRVDLGWHVDCHSAVKEAKKKYSNVDGCYYCCNPCHTR